MTKNGQNIHLGKTFEVKVDAFRNDKSSNNTFCMDLPYMIEQLRIQYKDIISYYLGSMVL